MDRGTDDLSVLSFNAKLFRAWKTYEQFSTEVIEWSASDTSDIKCFQEYSTNARWDVLNVTKKIEDGGYEHFVYTAELKGSDHNPGMAIFSKYPILDSGFVWKNKGTTNAGIYVDVKKNQDTVRIYNVHLESMYLRLFQFKSSDNYWNKVKHLISSLRNGARARSWQIGKISSHTQTSPYPFIICGDFNETPYSYNYIKLRSAFSNAFEEVGNGFGFTFNSILFFLRIDHQFFSSNIKPTLFEVDRSIRTSDHFPTRGSYKIN